MLRTSSANWSRPECSAPAPKPPRSSSMKASRRKRLCSNASSRSSPKSKGCALSYAAWSANERLKKSCPEWYDIERADKLFRDVACKSVAARAVVGKRSHALAECNTGKSRQSARSGQRRKAPSLRQPALRQRFPPLVRNELQESRERAFDY